MASEIPEHRFDPAAAARFRPKSDFVKTAILIDPVAPVTALRATFGEQMLRGSFYVVADGDGSYGVAREEFEETHESVGANRWVKRTMVLAYRSTEAATVVTRIDGEVESSVVAQQDDWIVQQVGGEVMVVEPDEFTARYDPIDD